MNWANRLTLSRLGLTILFVIALNSTWEFGRTAALILFVVAGVTDFFDGEIARRYSFVTNFGQADGSAGRQDHDGGGLHFAGAAESDSGVGGDDRGRARLSDHGIAADGEFEGPGSAGGTLGKHKTSWQIVTVIFFLVLLAVRELRYADDQSDWWQRAWKRRRGRAGLDYRGTDALLRTRLRLAASESVVATDRVNWLASLRRSSVELRPGRRVGV